MRTTIYIIIIAVVVAQWIWTRTVMYRAERALIYSILLYTREATPLEIRDWVRRMSGRNMPLGQIYSTLDDMIGRGQVDRLEMPATEARGGNKGYAYRLSLAALAVEAARWHRTIPADPPQVADGAGAGRG